MNLRDWPGKKDNRDKINKFAYSGILELFNAMKYPSNRNLQWIAEIYKLEKTICISEACPTGVAVIPDVPVLKVTVHNLLARTKFRDPLKKPVQFVNIINEEIEIE